MGGFRGQNHPGGGETSKDERRPYQYLTTLTGEIGDLNTTDDNSYHVVSAIAQLGDPDNGIPQIAIGNNIVLDGFIVTKGNATDDGAVHLNIAADGGGGIIILGWIGQPVSHPSIVRCRFAENRGQRGGAAMYRGPQGDTMTFTNCKFIDNEATRGGAVYSIMQDCTILFPDCEFVTNKSIVDGTDVCNTHGESFREN